MQFSAMITTIDLIFDIDSDGDRDTDTDFASHYFRMYGSPDRQNLPASHVHRPWYWLAIMRCADGGFWS